MAIDLSFYAHAIPLKLPQEDFCSSKNALFYPGPWNTKANPRLTMGFTKIIHECNWKGAQCIKWRHKAVKNGFDDGHEFESSAPKVDVDKLLAVAEVICIAPSLVLSVGFAVQSTIHKFQNVKSVTSTVPVNKHASMYITWQIIPLLGALIISAIIRTRQWHTITRGVKQSGKAGSPDFSLVQRVKKIEEDVGSSVTIIRVLSRQLEKLGVRFRVTRRTLRDPINETAALAQKTSEAVRALAVQENVLEKELREIQHILFAMQEQQQKQLELLLTLGKLGRLQEKTERSSVQGTEKPDDSQGNSGTKVLKLKGQTNIDRKDMVKENVISDIHHNNGNSGASMSQLSRNIDKSKSPNVYGSYNDHVNNDESLIFSFTGHAEMNPSHVPEVQDTVQDFRSKSDFVASNMQEKGEDLGRNTKEKSFGQGSGL